MVLAMVYEAHMKKNCITRPNQNAIWTCGVDVSLLEMVAVQYRHKLVTNGDPWPSMAT